MICLTTDEITPPDTIITSSPSDHLLASDPNTPTNRLVELAKSPDPNLRRRVAKNPSISLPLFFQLLYDAHPEVRGAVALNPQVPALLIDYLINDEVPEIRLVLAEDHSLLLIFLCKLCMDKNQYVAHLAQKLYRTI